MFERSLRRAQGRRRVLLAVASLSVSYAGPLAEAAGVSRRQLFGILLGDLPRYSVALSLVRLGLVRAVETPLGCVYEVTSRGRRKARQLAAREVRVAVRRASSRLPVGEPVASAAAVGASAGRWAVTWRVVD